MKINSISASKFNNNAFAKSQMNNTSYMTNCGKSSNFSNVTYPKNYFFNQITFGKKYSANDLIKIIGEENFPNPAIVNVLRELGESSDFSFYDIHFDFYKDLLDCSTLDEAKEKYPEFESVIDAKDVVDKFFDKNGALRNVSSDKIKGIDFDNLTLEILKRYYGKLQSVYNKENYWELTYPIVIKIFNTLNIKKINSKDYFAIAKQNSKEAREKRSNIMTALWENPEFRENHLQKIKKLWQDSDSAYNSEELRAKRSALMQKKWQDEEYRKKVSEGLKESWQDSESRFNSEEHSKKLSQAKKRMWQDSNSAYNSEEFREKQSEIRKRMWQDPEYREKMSIAMIEQWQDSDSVFNSEEFRTKKSKEMIKRWQDPESRAKLIQIFNSHEYVEKSAELARKHWQDPEYKKKMQKVYAARRKAFERHPEISAMMSEVAKSFSSLKDIISKLSDGVPLTEHEKAIRSAYYLSCERTMPGYQKIIGEEQRKILLEWNAI